MGPWKTGVRPDRLTRLVAVFDEVHEALARLSNPVARVLAKNWADNRKQFTAAGTAPRSALVAGLEQGLRELPMILSSMPSGERTVVAGALSAAVAAHYAEHGARDLARLERIKTRGSIRSEGEYHLVRYRMDALERVPAQQDELQRLQELVAGFEARIR